MRQSLSTWTSLGSKWGVTGSDLWYSGRGGPDGVGGGVVGCWSAAEERSAVVVERVSEKRILRVPQDGKLIRAGGCWVGRT